MVGKLINIYSRDHVLELEYRQYYDIIKPGYYFSEKQIVMVFKFPIVSTDIFDFYKLAIFPNYNKQALVPSFPYIATNRNSFLYIEAECPKFNNWFLCEKKANQIKIVPDCIQNFIQNQTLGSTCEMTTVTITRETMQELDERHYVLSFPHTSKTHTICKREDFSTLQGSYLVTIPANCIFESENFKIYNVEDKIKGQPMKISSINLEVHRSIPTKYATLNSINLEDLHKIQEQILLQSPIHIKDDTSILYHTTIPLYSIIIGAALVLTILILIRRMLRARTHEAAKDRDPEDEAEERKRSEESLQLPATFFHKVLK